MADVQQRVMDVLSPALRAPRLLERRDPRQPQRRSRMRQRLLTLPVSVARMVSLVWRRVPSIAEVQKILTREGALGGAPFQVSAQAITKRLDGLPTAVRGQVLTEVGAHLQAQPTPPLPHPSWAPVGPRFPVLPMVDGPTLEALRQKTPLLRQREGLVLARKLRVRVEAVSHRPLWQLSTEDALANAKHVAAEFLPALPVRGLLVCNLGGGSLLGFDDFTASDRFFGTRLREKTAYRTRQELRSSPHDRDELIQVGQYRANPGTYPRRMGSVRWQGVWYRYLTNVLEPPVLSARRVCELCQRRWRLEDAFALTRQLLDLAYVSTGSTNAVQWQSYATLIFYVVRVPSCRQMAPALGEPLERIAVEMVFCAVYHDSRAVQRGERGNLVSFLADHANLLGIVQHQRKSHRERQQLAAIIWGDP